MVPDGRTPLDDLLLSASLPSLPSVAFRVLELVQDPDATIEQLTRTLSQDPALAAKVLQASNSSLFRRGGGEVTSLERAATVLGFRAIKVISLGFSLQRELPTRGEQAGLDLPAFWHRSLAHAVIARLIARRSGSRLVEEAFLVGLLANLGKLALALAAPERYGPLVQEAGGWPRIAREREVLGYDSSEVTVAVMRQWGLPILFADGVRWAAGGSAEAGTVGQESQHLGEILRVALRVGRVLFDEDRTVAVDELSRGNTAGIGIEASEVAALLADAESGVAEAVGLLDLHLPAGTSYLALLDAARLALAQVGLDTVVHLHKEQERAAEFRMRAATDSLTGLPNRSAFDEFLGLQVAARERGGVAKSLGVMVLDIDRFKQVNDSFGHAVGDAVLQTVGRVLATQTRTNELAARRGGEEFGVILPSVDREELFAAAERLRLAIAVAGTPRPEGSELRVTVSVGAALLTASREPADLARLLDRADRQLYRAKNCGRNRVEVADDA